MVSFKLYDKHYMRLVAIPAVLTVAFLVIILVTPGITLGLDFVGGTRMIVNTDKLSEQPVRDLLTHDLGLPEVKVSVVTGPFGTSARIEYAEPKNLADARALLDKGVEAKAKSPTDARGFLLQAMDKLGTQGDSSKTVDELVMDASQVVNAAGEKISSDVRNELTSNFGLPTDTQFTIEQVTPTFGASFLANTLYVGIISIILLVFVIFIFFREVIPSLAVVEAALFDMLTAVALLTLFGFSITLATVAGLLMMVGYSVDTDILLTTRVLKRKDKSVYERSNDTLITGLTVTATLIGATLVMLIVSWSAQITTIYEIAATILFGLVGDMIATWLTNAPILLWYWEKKHGKVEHHS